MAKRSYGLPPAGHRKRAKREVRIVDEHAEAVDASLRAGDCHSAFNNILGMAATAGSIATDLRDGYGKKAHGKGRRLGRGLSNVIDRFYHSCVLPGGKGAKRGTFRVPKRKK